MRRRQRVGLTVAAIIAGVTLYEIVTSFLAYTTDAYVQSDLVAVAPQVTGRIIDVVVTDNQTVAVGDLLAKIDPEPFQLSVDQRRAEVGEAKAQVAADQDTIASTQDSLQAANAAAAYARDTQARLIFLAKAQDVSHADLQKAEDDLRQANAVVDAGRATVAKAQATAAMHLAAQARAGAALADAEWQLTRTRLTAPTSGAVTNLNVRAGDTAQANVPLIGIVDAHAFRVIANYKQSFIRGFTPGESAWVWLDSEPWHLHRARIAGVARGISRDPAPGQLLAYVSPTTDWIRLQRRFPVTLTLIDPPATLFMGADARVLILP